MYLSERPALTTICGLHNCQNIYVNFNNAIYKWIFKGHILDIKSKKNRIMVDKQTQKLHIIEISNTQNIKEFANQKLNNFHEKLNFLRATNILPFSAA